MLVLRNLLALTLAISLSPGLVELLDDAAHLALEGHTDHVDGEDACPEHGCTPGSHHCGCCTSIAVAGAPSAAAVPFSRAIQRRWSIDLVRRGPEGATSRLRRPPRA